MLFNKNLLYGIFSSIFLLISVTIAQNINVEKFQYLSPVPNSSLNSTGTNIIVRFGEAYQNINLDNCLIVKGEKSGEHTGKIILAESNNTLLFKPDNEFADDEIVSIELKDNLKTISNFQIPKLQFAFKTSKVDLNKLIRSDPEKYNELLLSEFEVGSDSHFEGSNITNQKIYTVQQDTLPSDFPAISVDLINNPSPGYIFLTPFSTTSANTPNYIIMTDNYAVPVFYRKMVSGRGLDFKKQGSSRLIYFNSDKYYVMDSSYNIIDSLYMQNGYFANTHEGLLLDGGYSLLFCYDYQQVNMDTVVSGGDTNATVIGTVIQELDENKNVVFQWRSWDHFKIADATYDIDLTASTIDYVHANALEVDNDGNILLSSRNLDEITKIDKQTGDVIWRMGGEDCENNQFTFQNDPASGFSHQHDIRRLENGNISLFDNGNLHSPSFSRAVEYSIDESNLTAALIWEYRNNPQSFSLAMGNCERLDNQNSVIGWGWYFNPPAITEVTMDKNILLSLSLTNQLVSYRGFKYQWKTNLFVANPDSLNFGDVSVGDSLILTLNIINNSNREISINGLLNRDSAFYVNTPLPVTISASGNANIEVTFKPYEIRDYSDDLYLQWNRVGERITQVVPMSGISDTKVPVELTSFTASVTDQTVSLNWTTATEINNLGFEIERNVESTEWIIRGFRKGYGTTTEVNNYKFKDQVKPGNYSYRLKQIDFDGTFEYSDIIEVNANNPTEYSLDQNYPNPFNPNTKIEFTIQKAGKVSLNVYDVMGKKVKTLINKKMASGSYKINFNGKSLPSGVYIYTITANDFTDSKKMLLLK